MAGVPLSGQTGRNAKEPPHGCPDQPLSGSLRPVAARSGRILGGSGQGNRLVRAGEKNLRSGGRHLRPLVRRRHLQHLLQLPRPPRRPGSQRPGGADLQFAGHRHGEDLHLRPPALRSATARRHAARLRRHEGRPRHHLHADDPGSGVRDARLRAHRRHPFGGVRRLRGERARHPHRRRQAEGHSVGELRHRRRARHSL